MIKHSSEEYKYQYLRENTEWQFIWDFQIDIDGTIRFFPLTKAADSASWYFCAQANSQGESSIDHQETQWQSNNPVFEYHSSVDTSGDGTGPNAATDEWDASHPNNLTRYLRPGDTGILKLINTVKYVHIDTVAPVFITDIGTNYTIFMKHSDTNVVRECSFKFSDAVGLDYKQIKISIGNDTIYEYSRKTGTVHIDTNKIKELKIFSSGDGTYKVEFKLVYGLTKAEVDVLNQQKLIIDVFDKSANHKEYTFGNNGTPADKGKKTWALVFTDVDFSKLKRLVIKYYDIEPEDMIVSENVVGSTWVSIYNPNKDCWSIPIAYQLSDDSVGIIDESTYDDSAYAINGTIKFKVTGIAEAGIVTTTAWLETGSGDEIDRTLCSATYAEESLGPWRVLNPDGRLYNLKIYVPTFLRHTEWFEFVKFMELYLNSCYTDMKKRTNISALEKIARILDFNEIDRMEDELLPYYAKQYGSEFDINLQSVKQIFEGKVDE